MSLEKSGEPVSVGCGAACLGNPLNAVLWLARTAAAMGPPLRAGDVVLSGALGPMVPVAAGAVFEARISGLGRVGAAFTREYRDDPDQGRVHRPGQQRYPPPGHATARGPARTQIGPSYGWERV